MERGRKGARPVGGFYIFAAGAAKPINNCRKILHFTVPAILVTMKVPIIKRINVSGMDFARI